MSEEIKLKEEDILVKGAKEQEMEEFFDILKIVSPGTKLRAAVDDIARAELGALIVIGDSPDVLKMANGGFKIDHKFTQQRLLELCKMDGAIILSDDMQKILYCNTLLTPNPNIESSETGTRHMAAERTAKQTLIPVIAVSERRKTITLFYKNIKYVLKTSEELLSKATETLRMLEKHKEILDQLLINLNILEFTSLVSLQDVISCIMRMELMERITETMHKYIVELGTEGKLIKILLREITKGLRKEKELLLRDYSRNWEFTKTAIPTLTLDDIIEPVNLMRMLLYSNLSDPVMPYGYRILSKTSLGDEAIDSLIFHFKNMPEIANAIEKPDSVSDVIGEKDTKKLLKELNSLKEQSIMGKKI